MVNKKMDNRIIELKTNVVESTQIISSQLSGIESSLLGAFVSIIASAFVSNYFGILKYWIPASFIVIWILLIYSLVLSIISTIFSLIKEKKEIQLPVPDEAQKAMNAKLPSSAVNRFVFTTKFKNATSFINAIGIVFFLSR